METVSQIKFVEASKSRINEVDFSNLGFGKEVTDYMFVAEYCNNLWNDLQIALWSNCIRGYEGISNERWSNFHIQNRCPS
jgi:hypothetical protein